MRSCSTHTTTGITRPFYEFSRISALRMRRKADPPAFRFFCDVAYRKTNSGDSLKALRSKLSKLHQYKVGGQTYCIDDMRQVIGPMCHIETGRSTLDP